MKIEDPRLLIFGGPYSNLAATRALRDRAERLDLLPRQVICTGDVVAYCGEPAETVDLLRDWGIPVVMGNCEESLANNEADCGCGFDPDSSCSLLAVTWYRYADARVGREQRRWMAGLPRALEVEFAGRRLRILHGSLDSINEFVFASSPASAKREQLERAGVDVIVGGHAGLPFGQAVGSGWWLNAGVIGMPANDGGPHGWYMLLEACDDGIRASWQRLDYDHESSARATAAAGMPEYGSALCSGLWPSMDILPPAERAQRGRALNPEPITLPALRSSGRRRAG